MTRSFKPLLGAVALAAAAFGSSAAFAAYSYNVAVSVTAPKGSAAEAAAKDKTLPTSIKYTTCKLANEDGSTTGTLDQFNFAVKYDAGKLDSEMGDVHVMFQSFAEGGPQYYALTRLFTPGGAPGAVTLVGPATEASALDGNDPYLAKEQNSGAGAQTEVLFGGNVTVQGLPKGVWAVTAIIAKPGYRTPAGTPAVGKEFKFTDRSTWAAFDTVPFVLGSPFEVSTVVNAAAYPTLSATCQ